MTKAARRSGRAVALLVAGLAAGCDTAGDEARREDLEALRLAGIGRPIEEQLEHVDRAVWLEPTSGHYRERRANLLFSLGRLPEARADYDRAVGLADRPYLRFERADLLCAQGEYAPALADLDRAIAAQPENTQFYPRRALARLALGRIAEARADVDHAMAASRPGSGEKYARAAVLLMEGKPAEALPDLDYAIAQFSDPSDGALPRTLRLLAHAALDQRELAAAEFDQSRLDGEAYWPYRGYRYWFVPRGCANAFIAAQAGALVSRAQSILAANQSMPGSSKPPVSGAASPLPPSPIAGAGSIILLDYLRIDGNVVRFSLNTKDLPDAALEAIERRKNVWLWTEVGQIQGVVESIERNAEWAAYRGGLVLIIRVARKAYPAKEGWTVLSLEPFPSQGWVSMETAASDKAQIARRLGYAPRRLTFEKFRARERQYLIADYVLPCPDGRDECGDHNEVETTVFERSSETGWKKIDSYVDGGSRPFVDIDGDGIPECVGSTGYKGYVLRRIIPKRQIVFTSHSGV